MKHTIIDGVLYKVLPVPVTSGHLKTSSVWYASKTGVRPCRNVKVLLAHLHRKRVKHSIPYGKEPFPRNC